MSVQRCASLLAELIGYRTDNPGGDELALCQRLADELRQRHCDRVDVVEVPRNGSRGAYVYARYGEPRLIVNAHIDTVPANSGWTSDPWTAETTDDRVIGLGACDTKGAAAAVLTALERQTPDAVGILFSGDEEVGTTCMTAFLDSEHAAGIERALVCEPTDQGIGVRHRGVAAYRARYQGKGGHSSAADRMPKPIVTMARAAVALDALGTRYRDAGPDEMKGICMNVADLAGGVAFNVVPDHAELSWSLRPPPGFDADSYRREQAATLAELDPAITIEEVMFRPPFATRDRAAFERLLGPGQRQVGLQFWTEAAVLASAGIDAVVLGVGDISRAHAAGEMVPLADLAWAIELFEGVFARTAS